MSYEIKIIQDVTAEPVSLADIKDFCNLDQDYAASDAKLLEGVAAAREKLEKHSGLWMAPRDAAILFYTPVFKIPYGPINEIKHLVNASDTTVEIPYEKRGLDFLTIIVSCSEGGMGFDWFYPAGGGGCGSTPYRFLIDSFRFGDGGWPMGVGEPGPNDAGVGPGFLMELNVGYTELPLGLKRAILLQIDADLKAQGQPDKEVLNFEALQLTEKYSRNLVLQ